MLPKSLTPPAGHLHSGRIRSSQRPLCLHSYTRTHCARSIVARRLNMTVVNASKNTHVFELKTIYGPPIYEDAPMDKLSPWSRVFAQEEPHKSVDSKAYVVLPSGCPEPQKGVPLKVEACGVVLFMHGFAQGPPAYVRMLDELGKSGFLVIAPCPPFVSDPEEQQTAMVDTALVWRHRIGNNKLPGIDLVGRTQTRLGLLAHSVGGGLAPYVKYSDPYSFVFINDEVTDACTAVHVMAPQTGVFKSFKYNDLPLSQYSRAPWSVQYGAADPLSNRFDVETFKRWLDKEKLLAPSGSYCYPFGTHVGFQDQLVVPQKDTSASVTALPLALAVLYGCLANFVPALVLRTLLATSETFLKGSGADKGSEGAGIDSESSAKGSEGPGKGSGQKLPGSPRSIAPEAAPHRQSSQLGAGNGPTQGTTGRAATAPAPKAAAMARRQSEARAEAEGALQLQGGGSDPPKTSRYGFGEPDRVDLPDEGHMFLGYTLLAAAVTAVAYGLPGFQFAITPSDFLHPETMGISAASSLLFTEATSVLDTSDATTATPIVWLLASLKLAFQGLSAAAWISLALYPYQARCQRPAARQRMITFFKTQLLIDKEDQR